MAKHPRGDAVFTLQQDGQGLVLTWGERLDGAGLEGALAAFARVLKEHKPARVELDMSQLGYLDSGGALGLVLMERQAARAGARFAVSNLSTAAQTIRALVDPRALDVPPLIPSHRKLDIFSKVGEGLKSLLDASTQALAFVGDLIKALGRTLANPRQIRWRDVAVCMERVGVDGLPIVGVISFLLGLIMAWMSSLQLQSFGANIFVASLVGLAMTRELGPIMTAVLIAGRSGSAFAAEIGTMKVNEEVDALAVMGYDPTCFLVLPKMMATLVVLPLLTLYADLLGILGGLVAAVLSMDLTVYAYIKQTVKTLDTFDVTSGLIKSLVFALIIAGVGCQQGFMVRGGAQGVGTATTSAVVAAMALIIVANCIFAILFYVVL